jgi:hypothetical protein
MINGKRKIKSGALAPLFDLMASNRTFKSKKYFQ